jgi:hypothetical protein
MIFFYDEKNMAAGGNGLCGRECRTRAQAIGRNANKASKSFHLKISRME